jgi:hypothetical protein
MSCKIPSTALRWSDVSVSGGDCIRIELALDDGSRNGYALSSLYTLPMKLSPPFSLRLTPELLQQLDSWRGDRMSRGTAIRILLEQALQHQRSVKR